MKKALLIVVVSIVVIALGVKLLNGGLSEMLGSLFGSDYTGISKDVYHGNYIKYEKHASGYQVLKNKYEKNELWYPGDDIYHSGHIITNDAEFTKLNKEITDQEIKPVDFDKYVLYADTVRTAPTTKAADRELRVSEIASFSANDNEVIVNRNPTNTLIKPADNKSHIGYYEILKIKKEDFPFEERDYRSFDHEVRLNEDKDKLIYLEP